MCAAEHGSLQGSFLHTGVALEPEIHMSYGKRVFDFVRPTFESSICTHYRDDFLAIDKATFETTAVPGVSYILHIRDMGTRLVVLGAFDQTDYVQAVLREADPKTCELYLIKVHDHTCSMKEITAQQALMAAAAKPKIEVRSSVDPFRVSPTLYHYYQQDMMVGSASISVRYCRATNRTVAKVNASVSASSDRLTQMQVALLIEQSCNKEGGTLFWTYEDYLVNEMPFDVWCKALTACPDTTQAGSQQA